MGDIHLISYTKNRGKGYAMAQGIQASRGEILVFFDGDVFGLTHRDLDLLVDPIVRGKSDVVIGLGRLLSIGSYSPFDELSGLRVLFKKHITRHGKTLKGLGYGVELSRDSSARVKPILQKILVSLKTVFDYLQIE